MSDEQPEPPKKKKKRPFWRKRVRRSTAEGAHIPVLLAEVLAALDPRPGQTVVDCTLGFAGHSLELLRRVAPDGLLIATDLDVGNIEPARPKLEEAGGLFGLHHTNFAGLPTVLAIEGVTAVDAVLADLGMSSMQVDDRDRGFSFMRDGPLDMRMDRTRGRTAAQLLATLSRDELAACFSELGDEPQAGAIADAVVRERQTAPVERTKQLRALIEAAAPVRIDRAPGAPPERKQLLAPVTRVFQALRILTNRELASLQQLLRVLPTVLKPGGVAAIISFHSGEDRLVKAAFRDGLRAGVYSSVSPDAIRSTFEERRANPRARSAKLRVARRAEAPPDAEPAG
ncbi:Ribosomal RNA small subunit methyltransferase H [Gemmata obscuriglobus]|uniref:Ribosomal RNA small subunit methyltransferase H n=1 Tax=Gemmata obscuriglobus TaxID=114 RepID=A0A2Z3GTI1_9BACT|nr:16S rRNA (cytosine(1402)-N(4))-methyltransferase RsmH [Gemmata obscuriglobus]AWM35831.1 16S rRNA (cytosine(1402)-N(4))-methyltransferase RsmH [Gemmata obscuriglobus]QEG31626.1 Ribosomal RNA small subunit methyltransferase H [Gemmata obscuriglobus]VTS10970.1 16s rrna methyltransferase : Ribosomal RNA small subunit methyltransferase H OS=Singulisphaera acidiphila (strain ATCC BAA-1392 / DSM 18658 / VKM B-2454 / MOB10) GN=rsmH PE=3 SV=1: Methyltransf_5 [Gemmata obscuriglobus UQM 2246]